MDKLKKVQIDSNFNWLGPLEPVISPFVIEYFELKEGETIIGFQDDQEWEGILRYDTSCPEGMQWYLDLNSSTERYVSMEQMQGREEGARSAIPIGELRGEIYVVTAMIRDGVDIETIKKYTRLSKTRLENIKKAIKY